MRWPILSVLLLCGAVAAESTVLVPTDLGDLSRGAYAIARGRIVAAEARWIDAGRRSIETIVTMAADVWLKGNLGGTIQFRVPGGRLGRYRSLVVGTPSFDAGQHVIVFLGAAPPALPYVLGLGQGVFRIAASPGGLFVTPAGVMPAVTGPAKVVRGDPSRGPVALAEFERRVRALTEELR